MSDQRNIVLITTDQQRFDTVAPFAPSFLRTPHLSFLQQEGITFTRAYSDCPLCVPARCSIMTGQFPSTHGQTVNGWTEDILNGRWTLPSVLGDAGYQTAAIGKMHFGPQRCRHGFHEMLLPDDYYRWIRSTGNPLQPMRHGMGQNDIVPTMATVPEALTLTSWISEQSAEYIRTRRDPTKPFFLWCSFSKPHPPFDPPEPYYSMYRDSDIPEPVIGAWTAEGTCPSAMLAHRNQWKCDRLAPQIIREARAAYFGMITQIDYSIGRVLQALQDRNLLAETLILFTSDHGEFLGDHRMTAKMFSHEPSTHIPMIVRLPASDSGELVDRRCEMVVTLADVMPTILAAGGIDAPTGMEGCDLGAIARGEGKTRPCALLHGPGQPWQWLCVVDGRWKYTYYPEGAEEQLFDLKHDPMEIENVAHEEGMAKQKKRLRDDMIALALERGVEGVQADTLPIRPKSSVSAHRPRGWHWPGFHSEYHDADVRH